MDKILITLLLGGGLLCNGLLRGESKPTAGNFSFMTGHWRCAIWGGTGEEIWTAASDGNMLGMFRYSKNGKLVFTEFLAFEDHADGAVLYMRHFHPQLKAWEDKDGALRWQVAESKSKEALFVREGGKMHYQLQSPDVLVATLTNQREGKSEVHVFRFERVKAQ